MKSKKVETTTENEADTKDNEEPLEFAYEVSSTTSEEESIAEISDEEGYQEELEEEPKRASTIKIISEKDMEIKEVIPPNFSPYLKCYQHFKGKEFIKRKRLKQKQ
ncbi:MAG: hypothetical protein E3J70_02755 [Candidatus Heimdallarchaeota archaeon]|nr:MAG: hypothetical protein E3J70_02755 [Candidatus Heimdallarchaeota archaeon]